MHHALDFNDNDPYSDSIDGRKDIDVYLLLVNEWRQPNGKQMWQHLRRLKARSVSH